MEEQYYQINHKSSFNLMDTKAFCYLKSQFFLQLASSKDEVNFWTSINKFIFLFIKIPNLNHPIKEKLNVIEEVINLYCQKMSIDINDNKNCMMLCQKVSMRNYKTEFVFQSSFVEEIAIILCYGFKNIMNSNFNTINTFSSFLQITERLREANIDIVNQYRYNGNDNNHNSYLNSNEHPIKHKYGIPNELILLMNKFSVIKKIILNVDEWSDELILAYTLIILNYQWLFYYILDVVFDLSCVFIQKKIWNVYERELYFLNQEMKRKSSIGSNDSDNLNKSIENETISDIRENQSNIFLLVIFYSHFISQLPHLTRLSIIFPQNFKNEIIDSLSSKVLITMKPSFHFLNLLSQVKALSGLSIEFNSLEASSFQNIISIINNNTYLKYLTLALFSKRDDQYYSSPSLYKTALDEGINLSSISSKSKQDIILSNVFSCNSNDFAVIDNALIKQLLPEFESNMEKLFILLQSKKDLISFELYFDIPKRLSDNEKYYFTLIKFILNIFLLLHRERHNIKELKLISPMMIIDNRKYPLLENYFDGIDMLNKNPKMAKLHLHLNFKALSNISNIISVHLKFLSLGDLDLDSFNAFCSFYHSDQFANRSSLVYLSLSLSKTIFDYNTFKPQLVQLMPIKKPLTLRHFSLHCNSVIKANEMNELLSLGNGNYIEKYVFSINPISKSDYAQFNYDQYYYYYYSASALSSNAKKESYNWTIIRVLLSMNALSHNTFSTLISYCKKGRLKKKKEVVIQMNN